MEHDQQTSKSKTEAGGPPLKSPAAQLRKIGWSVLLGGFAIAGMIYAFAPDDTSAEDNPWLAQYYDKQAVAVERMWGREGSLTLGLTRSLKRASTYSAIVIIVSALGSFTCFYLARDAYDGKEGQQVKLVPQPPESFQEPTGASPTKDGPDD